MGTDNIRVTTNLGTVVVLVMGENKYEKDTRQYETKITLAQSCLL